MKKVTFQPVSRTEMRNIKGGGIPKAKALCPVGCSGSFDCGDPNNCACIWRSGGHYCMYL